MARKVHCFDGYKNSFDRHIDLGVFDVPMCFAGAWGIAQSRVLVS
jgi:hypothetical protein